MKNPAAAIASVVHLNMEGNNILSFLLFPTMLIDKNNRFQTVKV